MRRSITPLMAAAAMAITLPSCLDSERNDFEDWRQENDSYIAALNKTEYTLVTPDWAPQNSVYIKWHNDRDLTKDNLVAMSNSTVDIKYELEDISGARLDDSYGVSTGDSVYSSMPSNNVVGMWIAMTTMHVGDSATVIVPYPSGYGASSNGSVKPYSNLIFHMKVKGIKAFEKPNS